MGIYFKIAGLLQSGPAGVMDFLRVGDNSKTLPPSLEVISAQQRLKVLTIGRDVITVLTVINQNTPSRY